MAPGAGPQDVSRALAFLAAPDQGITYRMNVWHHGLTVLDRPARFAVLMWRNGTASDEEFVPVPRMTVHDRGDWPREREDHGVGTRTRFRGIRTEPTGSQWPGGARLAVNFVMNYEEGSEPSIPDGEGRTEGGLTEAEASTRRFPRRDLAGESMFEYGSRVGFWRLSGCSPSAT